ncbi:tannase/feruloyl esterase family alpha/beta hydrolase [Pseudomonas sp. S9]|uniref:tannase/feruloyl esterase family alpha/beta hydrolase n=1 Tax=Pseudomonas sp. S9 TaxID=686578 RepID=UPI0009FC23E6|nr:tannase/feruloyl esterase family alpha/beta hydrolase [Pseudomonas sp. S9]
MGTGGGGNRSHHEWSYPEGIVRIMTMPIALRNGFATAATDAGYGDDPRFADWPLDEATNQLDWSLIENWLHRSKHDMAVIAKAVIGAAYGESPIYSYFQGTSGGGRDALAQVQQHPEDFDGIWASDPAINWTKLCAADLWPAMVMKESGNPLPPEKLRVFRRAVLEDFPWLDGSIDHHMAPMHPVQFDANKVVGTVTDVGPITERDAEVMNKIWTGPVNRVGKSLWFGLRPGTESWGDNLVQFGIASTKEVNGVLEPEPFVMAVSYFKTWIFRDPNWDWKTLDTETYLDLFEKGVSEFSSRIDTNKTDLSAFSALSHKLLLTQGAADGAIFPDGVVEYYKVLVQENGGLDTTKDFLRFFLSPGDYHSSLEKGPGINVAEGMTALMRWVEEGEAPDSIQISAIDPQSGQVRYIRSLSSVEAMG